MEKKRFVISVCALALTGLISTWIFAGIVERENNRWLYDVTDSLVTEIVRRYPDVEEETIRQMTSDGLASQKESVLKKYGIEEDNFFAETNRWKSASDDSGWDGWNFIFGLCRMC